MSPIPVLISAFAPFPKTLSLSLDEEISISQLGAILKANYGIPQSTRITLQSGQPFPSLEAPLSSLNASRDGHPILLRLSVKLCGGKGGFGSQLRAAGGRMAGRRRHQEYNNDSCRDLAGRRIASVKEAARVAAYVESAPEREKQSKEVKQAKLEALQKEVNRLDAVVSGTSSLGKRKGREQDEFIEQSKEAVDNVRGALAAAMLKKRKKNADLKLMPATVEPVQPIASSSKIFAAAA